MKSFSRSFPIILVICAIAIGAALTYLILFSWGSLKGSLSTQVIQNREQRTTDQVSNQEVVSQTATTTPAREGDIQGISVAIPRLSKQIYAKARRPRMLEKSQDQVLVDWTEAEEIPQAEWGNFFGGVLSKDAIQALSTSTKEGIEQSSDEYVLVDHIWRIGTVSDGAFQGGGVYTADLNANFPFSQGAIEFVRSEDGMHLIAVQRTETEEDPKSIFQQLGLPVNDEVLKLYGGTFPKNLHIKGRNLQLSSVYSLGMIFQEKNYQIDDSKLAYVATSDEGVELYRTENPGSIEEKNYVGNGCLFALMADGSWMRYSAFLTAFVDKDPQDSRRSDWSRLRDPGIDWDRAYDNTNTYYGVTLAGCGFGTCSDLINMSSDEEADLIQIGVDRVTKDPVYAFQHPETSKTIKLLYDTWFSPDGKKPELKEMIGKFIVPVFFWKDPLGRWNRYTVSELQPAVECGKPVIYLYPKTKTDVHVSLPKFISVTVSDPLYPSDGWNVTANPNGDLLSHADGKTYGSLYWEGTGVDYQTPKTGFIIKDGDVSSFLVSILPKYGLNEKEANEFMDFWIPKLTGASYYRISFLTDEWSKAAPLFVTPRPSTSIRIFMDWQPLSAPISIARPKIVTPKRDGFTLVEWGGTLYK